ncbi:HTH domain-containing protein [Clostridium sp. USBA 49]|nr:HTH domain-containing protein [Clostridium sp. USBA 49]SKA82986.1 HTH domain-containing protein [Clostridium sp. USBA 49]
MPKDVLNQIKLLKEEIDVLNKSKLAKRFNCDRRTIDKYIKDSSNEFIKP